MSNKSKGSNAERELFQMFVDNSYRAIRAAGSGTMDNASCDLLAGKKDKKYCIEVKSSKSPMKYITKAQIEEFMIFADIFGLEPIIALRFNRKGWYFINPSQLRDSGKNWAISVSDVENIGKRFGQMFN